MPPNDLTPFAFEERMVRVRLDEQGEPWFVAKDVCLVLELGNVTEALRNLDEDEFRNSEVVDSLGRRQEMRLVSESGLYALIFRSRKPEAKRFRRWVTREVLPALRRTGRYAREPGEARADARYEGFGQGGEELLVVHRNFLNCHARSKKPPKPVCRRAWLVRPPSPASGEAVGDGVMWFLICVVFCGGEM